MKIFFFLWIFFFLNDICSVHMLKELFFIPMRSSKNQVRIFLSERKVSQCVLVDATK